MPPKKQPTYKEGYVFVDVSYLVFYRFSNLRNGFFCS